MTGPRIIGWRRCRWATAGLARWSLAARLWNTCSLMKNRSGRVIRATTPTPTALLYLPKVREAVFAGDYALADQLVKQMQGPYTQSYLPFGDVYLEFEPTGAPAATGAGSTWTPPFTTSPTAWGMRTTPARPSSRPRRTPW